MKQLQYDLCVCVCIFELNFKSVILPFWNQDYWALRTLSLSDNSTRAAQIKRLWTFPLAQWKTTMQGGDVSASSCSRGHTRAWRFWPLWPRWLERGCGLDRNLVSVCWWRWGMWQGLCVCVWRLSLVNGGLAIKRGSVCIKHTLFTPLTELLVCFSAHLREGSSWQSPLMWLDRVQQCVVIAAELKCFLLWFRPHTVLTQDFFFSFQFSPGFINVAAAGWEDWADYGLFQSTFLMFKSF